MATREELVAQLAQITEAIASPERQVTLGSQNVTLRSIDDLIKARGQIEGDIAAIDNTTNATPRTKRYYATYSGRGHQ